jgi:hypothetical protein
LDMDSSGRWSLQQYVQAPVDDAGRPLGSFTDICAKEPERCK